MTRAFDFASSGAELKSLLGLKNPPIAIAFLKERPAGIRKNTDAVPSGCVFWTKAFTETFYTDPLDHANCNIGSFTHGFLAPESVSLDKAADIKLFQDTGYFPVNEFGKVPRMLSEPAFVAYAPLHKAPFEPDVVLLVCVPQQAMLIAEAAESPKLMGAPTCGAIPMAYNEGHVGISLGCVTNRVRTGIKPNELVVTIPKDVLPGFMANLRRRVGSNNLVAQAVTAMLKAGN